MAKVGVGVFLKHPAPGFVKTRLAADIGPGPAAAVYRECARASIAAAVSGIPHAACSIFYSPSGARRAIMRFVRRGVPRFAGRFIAAGRGDLGSLIERAQASLRAAGCGRQIVLGTDAPTIPARYLRRAVTALSHADGVIGPTRDGGFYLIGLVRPHRGLFRRIAWSSGRECAQVRANARRLGFRVRLLPRWFDVDRAADLRRLLAGRGGSRRLRMTARRALASTPSLRSVAQPQANPRVEGLAARRREAGRRD